MTERTINVNIHIKENLHRAVAEKLYTEYSESRAKELKTLEANKPLSRKEYFFTEKGKRAVNEAFAILEHTGSEDLSNAHIDSSYAAYIDVTYTKRQLGRARAYGSTTHMKDVHTLLADLLNKALETYIEEN